VLTRTAVIRVAERMRSVCESLTTYTHAQVQVGVLLFLALQFGAGESDLRAVRDRHMLLLQIDKMTICSNRRSVSSVTANRHAFIGRGIDMSIEDYRWGRSSSSIFFPRMFNGRSFFARCAVHFPFAFQIPEFLDEAIEQFRR
jgi:hypothetical protein